MANRDEFGRFKKNHNLNSTYSKGYNKKAWFKIGNTITNTGRTRFKKGHRMNLGKKMSESTIEKIRNKLIGRPSKFKGKKRPEFAGKNNPAWKGGVTKKTNKIRNSIEYISWRTQVFERDKFTCKKCGIIGANLNAHHKIPFSELINTKDEKLIFDLNNGITLCVDCHQKEHPKLNFKINKR